MNSTELSELTNNALQSCASDLSNDDYHAYADDTMERLLDSLEHLLDDLGNAEYEVEYSVSTILIRVLLIQLTGLKLRVERRPDSQTWRQGHLCHQQATSKQANMALVTYQVGLPVYVRFFPCMTYVRFVQWSETIRLRRRRGRLGLLKRLTKYGGATQRGIDESPAAGH